MASTITISGADPGFQVRGAHLKKLRRAEGDAKMFGVFRMKNHDFTPKNHIFSNFRGAAFTTDVVHIAVNKEMQIIIKSTHCVSPLSMIDAKVVQVLLMQAWYTRYNIV